MHREARRAAHECLTGRRLSHTLSREDLLYAAHHLSPAAREYTECETLLTRGAFGAGQTHGRRRIYLAVSPRGLADARPARFAVEPDEIVLFPREGWSLTGLRWRGWGTARARGEGASLERTCEPNCTQASTTGSFRRSPATIELWKPGRLAGHLVYRCFRLEGAGTVPSMERGCS